MAKLRVPHRFAAATLRTVDAKQFKGIFTFLNTVPAKREGIVLAGPPGVGKTWAMAALLHELRERKELGDYEFITAPDLFERFDVAGETERGYDSYRGQKYERTLLTVPLLIINDLGKEYRGGKLSEQVPFKLGRVLRARSESKLLTCITTNLPLRQREGVQSLEDVYGSSITSLLVEMTKMYEVQGPDRRR